MAEHANDDHGAKSEGHDDRSKQPPASDSKPDNSDNAGDSEDDDTADKGDGKPPLYKRPLFWIVAILVVAVLIVGGLLYWLHARQYESTDDAFIDAHLVRLSPQVSGVLTQVSAQDNRHVEPGQLLAVIEPSGPQAQREQAQAEVAQARAGIAEAQGKVIAAQASRAQSAADAVGPAAEARRAAQDYARYQALVRLDPAAAAATQVDQARASAQNAAAQAAAARRAVDNAAANILVARKGVESARAQVTVAQAKVKQSDVTIGDLRLTAPIAGQVVNRSVNVGSYVSPGQQLMAIVPDAVWVTANFKETQLERMRIGQHVDIEIDAYPGVHFDGHVDSIQRGAGQAFALLPAQNATGNYVKVVQRVPVRILFDHPDAQRYPIGPGMSVVPRVKVR